MEDSEKIEHPSFGMLSLGRVQGNANLNGSSIRHQHFYRLTIQTATLNRSLYRDWWFGRKQLVEINLSPNQLVDMISHMNTSGIPCTLKWTQDNGAIPDPPEDHIRDRMHQDISEAMKEVGEKISQLSKETEDILNKPGTLKKADKERLAFLAMKIKQTFDCNMSFMHKSHEEHLEKVISQVGSEVESNISAIIRSTGIKGIESLIGDVDVPLLADNSDPEIDHE